MITAVVAQATTQVIDEPGWGLAEWIGVATLFTLVLGAVVSAIVQLVRLRRENTEQHRDNQHAVKQGFSQIDRKLDQVTAKIDHIDSRVDNHLDWHHRQSTERFRTDL